VFTGLVEEVGAIERVENTALGRRLWIRARRVLDGVRLGDSLSVSGCCLTVVAVEGDRWAADVVPETLSRTTLGEVAGGDPVNLERPLRFDQRLGGHLVQGHVDGVGEITGVSEEGGGRRVRLRLPSGLERFVAEKGSLAVDGTSLTVAACSGATCEIAYIPHTLAHTVAGRYAVGHKVNLEVDLVARYVARLLSRDRANSSLE